ncbi:site-specific integrase [Methylomonas sp. LW13]|uniref:gamma-mobile-trio recombinase GmtY n=1 Tax=unclassified Methylomonas TaxID=2608980 RepID=UPI00051C3F30|nr:gamma-mobile-trio recombinase GmtY [Methylomonas sp. LW13]QBC25958.1 site-specific integrase [Methylomonas sp. LW13]
MAYTHKISVNYNDVESGHRYRLPAIYTDKGLVISHLRYLAWYHEKSESWKERSVFSLRLLIDYINAVPKINKASQLLKNFTRALVTGTIDYELLTDPLNLYWRLRELPDANTILFHITHYTDFLALQDGYSENGINPFRESTNWEERLYWCAYYQKQANVFLNHLSKKSEAYVNAKQTRLVAPMLVPHVKQEKTATFPEEHLDNLLENGFKVNGKQDFRSQAITILLNYGGLRKSEVFHLYISDITLHPNHHDEALVRIYHPQYGAAPDPKFKNRMDYLQATSSVKPRNTYRLSERRYAGWKNPLLTSKSGFFDVIFNPPEKAKDFLIAWINYLKYQRVEPKLSHPFAFTNSIGEPETLKNYQRKHRRAVESIGLKSKKELGTTEHGHRHAYGYRARKSGLNQIEIQKAMHHKSPLSCLVYIQPTSDDIRNKMKSIEK